MLHYQPRAEGAAGPRIGLVVGKKLLKRAVDRNCVKRCVREHFRRHRLHLPPCDLIVRLVARPAPLEGKALAADFQGLLEKLRQRWAPRGEFR